MLQDMFLNFAVLTISTMLGGWFSRTWTDRSGWGKAAVAGTYAGCMAILLMIFTVHVMNDVIIDARTIAVILAAYYGGLPAALLSAGFISVFRLSYFEVNEAALVAVSNAFVIAFATSWIAGRIERFSMKWLAMTAAAIVPVCASLAYLLPDRVHEILPAYVLFFTACSLYSYAIMRIQNKASEEHRTNMTLFQLTREYQQSKDIAEVYAVTLQQLMKHFRAEFGSVYTVQQGKVMLVHYSANMVYQNCHKIPDEDIAGYLPAIHDGKLLVYPDWSKSTPRVRIAESMYARGMRSSIHFPLLHGGKVAALINLGAKTAKQFSAKDGELFNALNPLVSMVFELKDVEDKFEIVNHAAMDAIILADEHGYIRHWNEGAAAMFGHSYEEAMGQHILILMPSSLHEYHHHVLNRMNSTSNAKLRVHTIEQEGVRKDGTTFQVELTLNMRTKNGDVQYIAIIRDVSQRKEAEQEVYAAKQELADTLRLQQGLTFKFKKISGKFVYTMGDGQLFTKLGMIPETMVGKTVEEVMPAELVPFLNEKYEQVWTGEMVEYEQTFNGYTYLNRVTPIRSKQGQIIEGIASGADVTRLKRVERELRESEERHRRLIELSPNAIVVMGDDGRIVLANSEAARLVGETHEQSLIGRGILAFVPTDDRANADQAFKNLMADQESVARWGNRLVKSDGSIIDVELAVAAIHYQDQPSFMLILRDVTLRKQAEARLQEANQMLARMAKKDGLTGIANRRHFDERFVLEWNRAIDERRPIAIVLGDIDYFKGYNDYYGHLGGDECLKQVAAAAERSASRPADLAARYGGEEFILLLPDTDEAGAIAVARSFREAVDSLKVPHAMSKVSTNVTVSAGVASIYPEAELDPRWLIDQADKALYQAKLEGRNRVVAAS